MKTIRIDLTTPKKEQKKRKADEEKRKAAGRISIKLAKSPISFGSWKKKESPRRTFRFKSPRIGFPKVWKLPIPEVLLIILIILGIAAYGAYHKIYKPALRLQESGEFLASRVEILAANLEAKDLTTIDADIDETKFALRNFENDMSEFVWMKRVPIARGYYHNAEYALQAAHHGLNAAEIVVPGVDPIADIFGFKSDNVEVLDEDTGEQKLERISQAIPELTPLIEEARPEITKAVWNLEQIDENYLPTEVKGIQVKEKIVDTQAKLESMHPLLNSSEEIVQILPDIVGVNEPKTYLILLQNDKELRPSGGFWTAFGYLDIDNGKIGEIETEDIYQLDMKINYPPPSDEYLQKYNNVYKLYVRDANLSADVPQSIDNLESIYYGQYAPEPFDGILLLDTHFVEDLVAIVGPIEMPQYNEIIDENNMVFKLEYYVEKSFRRGPHTDRKQFVEDLMLIIKDKVMNAKEEELDQIMNALMKAVDEKHLMFNFKDPQLQELAKNFNMTGEIEDQFDGDYLSIVESNYSGKKTNLFLEKEVEQEINISSDGSIERKVKITWTLDEVNDGWLTHDYYGWIRLYVPKGSELIGSSQGEEPETKVSDDDELNKTVFENVVLIETKTYESDPPTVVTFEILYKLPFTYDQTKPYQLLIQKQPGLDQEKHTITISDHHMSHIVEEGIRQDRLYVFGRNKMEIYDYGAQNSLYKMVVEEAEKKSTE